MKKNRYLSKIFATLLLSSILVLGLTGCGKDNLKDTWLHSGSEYTIADKEGEDSVEITLGSGDNYIKLRGEDFNGSLKLEVK